MRSAPPHTIDPVGLTEAETAFFALCLCSDDRVTEAYANWRRFFRPDAPPPISARIQDLQPLAARHLPAIVAEAPEALAVRFRTALLIEEKRLTALRALAADIVSMPIMAAHDPIMRGGLAFGETIFPGPNLRHTSSINLVLPRRAPMARIAASLRALGFTPSRSAITGPVRLARQFRPRRIELRHETGMPLLLERASHLHRVSRISHRRLIAGATTIALGSGTECLIPSTEDGLLLHAKTIVGMRADRPKMTTQSPLWLADLVYLRRALGGEPGLPAELAAALRDIVDLAERIAPMR